VLQDFDLATLICIYRHTCTYLYMIYISIHICTYFIGTIKKYCSSYNFYL